jgi:6-phosphofructokinase 2
MTVAPGAATPLIVTLTLNPALDLSTAVDTIEPWRKMRCDAPRVDPGGGGVNVARALLEIGGDPLAVVALGGHVGSLVASALRRDGIPIRRVPVRGGTRQNYAVTERSTGNQFRFVHSGPPMSAREWGRCLEATVDASRDASCVVASSSLPPGVPDDAFTTLASRLERLGVPLIVDTSGAALRSAVRAPVTLVKPSINELRALVGSELTTLDEYETAARLLLDSGLCTTIAVSLGAEGALIVPRLAASFVVHAPHVTPVSSIGAGDSMVAGLAFGIARGQTLQTAARFGVAAGTAAVLAEGTGLCTLSDIERLLPEVTVSER